MGAPTALVFSSGYLANLGVLTALGGPDVTIVSDAANHASIVDGCRLSRSPVVVVPHRDVDKVDAALSTVDTLACGGGHRRGVLGGRRPCSVARSARGDRSTRCAARCRRGARAGRRRCGWRGRGGRGRPGGRGRCRPHGDAVQITRRARGCRARARGGARPAGEHRAGVHLRHRTCARVRGCGAGRASRPAGRAGSGRGSASERDDLGGRRCGHSTSRRSARMRPSCRAFSAIRGGPSRPRRDASMPACGSAASGRRPCRRVVPAFALPHGRISPRPTWTGRAMYWRRCWADERPHRHRHRNRRRQDGGYGRDRGDRAQGRSR